MSRCSKRNLDKISDTSTKLHILDAWERDAHELITKGMNESARSNGRRLLARIEKWRKEITE